MRRSTIDQLRENLRVQQVFNVLLRYGMDNAFERLGPIDDFRRLMQRWVWQLPEEVQYITTPVKVRLLLEELGPTYVKMGQIVSSQSSVLPMAWSMEMEKLQSNVPPFASTMVRQILTEELGAPPDEVFASFATEPLAAASTAQVHRAVLDDGREVVVKVQRPGIRSQMKADLGIMQNASRVLSKRSWYLQAIDLEGMVQQFSRSVLDELDYGGEAYNAFRLAQSMDDIEGVGVPAVYPDYSTSKVLTMDFVRGVKVSNIAAIDEAGLDKRALARNALRAVIKQMFIDGLFHADPHPGNLYVDLDTGRLTFLDLGMVGELGVHERLNIVQLLISLKSGDIKSTSHIMRSLSVPYIDAVDDKAFYRDFERTFGRYSYAGAGMSLGASVGVMFDILREHGLRLAPELTMAIKAIVQLDSVATLLYPQGGLVAEGSDMAIEMGLKEITSERVTQVARDQLVLSAREVARRVPDLQTATVRWLEQYERGRFEVHVNTAEVSHEVEKVSHMLRLAVIAILLVGILIGSAIATSAISLTEVEGDVWDLIGRLAYIGYVFSAMLALLVVIRLIWRWLRGKPTFQD